MVEHEMTDAEMEESERADAEMETPERATLVFGLGRGCKSFAEIAEKLRTNGFVNAEMVGLISALDSLPVTTSDKIAELTRQVKALQQDDVIEHVLLDVISNKRQAAAE